ncbi:MULTISPECIES: hypothetical protein [Pseudomonas]|uniref:Uncharacterized protein n=2 Tax=Pseudomonas putida TaxID=303 RepID=A0AA34RVD8_PSEPU|nr:MULTISPECIES: hypothetical protein [Pseudomonas]HBK48632.1 hypothetical protein [Pseudomonas sp.]AJA14236.1 hypothetical protein RPPX_13055 [Pseudomonas putida S12]AOX11179.1 hypothetical protein Q5O_23240 [Pseudomonas putida JB]AVD93686.1 hypothetical protein C4Q27_15305 [Pseudomonas sp. SWI36]MBI6886036.1 hypothetical protein [Pseudomonas putida]
MINASAALPWLMLLLVPALWKFLLPLALCMTIALVYIEVVKKMTVRAVCRRAAVFMVGRVRTTHNLLKELAR